LAINVSFDEVAPCLAIFGTTNFKTDMKKIILMALIAAPIWAGAQTTKPAEKVTGKQEVKDLTPPSSTAGSKSTVTSPESIFAELIVSENQMGGIVIRVDFGRDVLAGIEDKELMMKIKEAREIQFVAVPDALTYMNSLGFKFVTSYAITSKTTETHMVLEKRMARKGDNGKGGQSGAERPERPEGSKPTTGTGDKKPAPSPVKSDGKK
jgi:TfoX/Sxy family transcriptional regulator of competence genes